MTYVDKRNMTHMYPGSDIHISDVLLPIFISDIYGNRLIYIILEINYAKNSSDGIFWQG